MLATHYLKNDYDDLKYYKISFKVFPLLQRKESSTLDSVEI